MAIAKLSSMKQGHHEKLPECTVSIPFKITCEGKANIIKVKIKYTRRM